MDIGKR